LRWFPWTRLRPRRHSASSCAVLPDVPGGLVPSTCGSVRECPVRAGPNRRNRSYPYSRGMDPSAWTLDPSMGEMLVGTESAGPAARLGHDLTIEMTDWMAE